MRTGFTHFKVITCQPTASDHRLVRANKRAFDMGGQFWGNSDLNERVLALPIRYLHQHIRKDFFPVAQILSLNEWTTSNLEWRQAYLARRPKREVAFFVSFS